FDQRPASEIIAIQMKQVEGKGEDTPVVSAFAERRLQGLKSAPAVFVKDNCLHIQYSVAGAKVFDGFPNRGELVRPVETTAGSEAHCAIGTECQQAVTIELDFVKPPIAFGGAHPRASQARRMDICP